MTGVRTDYGQVAGHVRTPKNRLFSTKVDRSDRFGRIIMTTSPTRTHKGYRENVSKPVQTCPNRPQQFNEAQWLDPTAPYDGPVDADLSNYDMRDLAAFWAEAETSDRETMRGRWAHYRGKVPAGLARDLIDDLEAREAHDGEQG